MENKDWNIPDAEAVKREDRNRWAGTLLENLQRSTEAGDSFICSGDRMVYLSRDTDGSVEIYDMIITREARWDGKRFVIDEK